MIGGHQIHWFPLMLVGSLALLGYWLNQVIHHPEVIDNAGFAHEPDTIVHQFNALTYDKKGDPKHRLACATLTHYLDDDTTSLERPQFSSLDNSGARIHVSAQRG